jgi:hypothetical protein
VRHEVVHDHVHVHVDVPDDDHVPCGYQHGVILALGR